MFIRVVLDHGLLYGSLQLSPTAVDRRQRKRLSSSTDPHGLPRPFGIVYSAPNMIAWWAEPGGAEAQGRVLVWVCTSSSCWRDKWL